MAKFDTKVQYLKYNVLLEVAKHAWDDTLLESITDIPKKIVSGRTPTMRCCVYKERAILGERVKLAMGGNKKNKNVIEVIDIACDDCPAGGYEITNACRGCLAHRCMEACKKGAISIGHDQRAHIDKTKCIECGLCAKACPYSAIINTTRPCQNSCKVKAISMSEEKFAQIDDNKCISCGACVYQCPFGAISDKSFILDVIDIIKKSEGNTKYKVFAVVAPAVAAQFGKITKEQIAEAIKKLGFYAVVEAALGADMVAFDEVKELAEKGFLTSSCCPAFVSYVEKQFPMLKDNISGNLSPMATVAKKMKEFEPNSKIVFVGPCTAKKAEYKKETVRPYIDSVITFEELQALIDSKGIEPEKLKGMQLDDASYFGRVFARSGGLTEAVIRAAQEHGLDFEVKPTVCDGIEQCKIALMKAAKKLSDSNFIEGMACLGGCVGGAGCITHGDKNRKDVDAYGAEAGDKSIKQAIDTFNKEGIKQNGEVKE